MRKVGKALIRETSVTERNHAIVVTLHGKFMELHLKGTRERYTLSYDAALSCAAKISVSNGGK